MHLVIPAQGTVFLLLEAWGKGTGVMILSGGGRMMLSGHNNEVLVGALEQQPSAGQNLHATGFLGWPRAGHAAFLIRHGACCSDSRAGIDLSEGPGTDTLQTILLLFLPKQPNARYEFQALLETWKSMPTKQGG